MSVYVKFFASIREKTGKSEEMLDASAIHTVADVWSQATDVPLPANTLAAINQEYVRLEATVHDGDEVAFFPPVTGG